MTPLIKTITVDGFYSQEEAKSLSSAVYYLNKTEKDVGYDIQDFNFIPETPDSLFSKTFGLNLLVNEAESGVFRIPKVFTHFESFDSLNDWIFVVAIQSSMFNILEHKLGSRNALEGYNHSFQNLLEWDLVVSHMLTPGQGVLFRPWLFHSFDSGMIQIFKITEVPA